MPLRLIIQLNLLIKTMITIKIEKLQQMANFEGDVRDGNIGSFSQGVVAGERNASKLALEVIEEILKESKPQDILQPTNEVRLIVNGVDIFISQWKLEPICPLSIFSHSAINGYKFSCRINDMSELRLIQEENSVIELVVLDERFVLREFAFASDEPIFSGRFLRKKVLEEIYGLKNKIDRERMENLRKSQDKIPPAVPDDHDTKSI